MLTHRNISATLVTVLMTTTILFATPVANAQTTNSQTHVGFLQGLIQFFTQEFGLNKSQVQSAVQQYQNQRNANITPRPTLTQQQMTTREKSRLDKLVNSNKITSAQEEAILNELSTVQTQYNWSSLKNDTPSQRKSQIQQIQNTLKTWAQSQNINPMYVMMSGGMKGARGMMWGHGGKGKHNNNQITPTPGS